MILLDTDVCIELLRGNALVLEKRATCDDSVAISFMTLAELFYGVERSNNREKNTRLVEEFILSLTILQSDRLIMQKFGELKAMFYQRQIMLPDADIFIAATALTKCSKLIAGNEKHFSRFDGLLLENWIR